MSKNNTPTISLEEMVSAVQAMTHDPQLLKLYDEGDKLSSSQTKHDVGHAFSVLNTARYLTDDNRTELLVDPGAASARGADDEAGADAAAETAPEGDAR